jgi:DNA-binding MurR/RpiR family transcriptional regulator
LQESLAHSKYLAENSGFEGGFAVVSTLTPTPVLEALRLAAAYSGDVGWRLFSEIARDFPESLHRRTAQLLTAADATAEDLDRLLHDAGLTDANELRIRAGKESNRRLAEPDLLFTSRDSGQTGDRTPLGRTLHREQENLASTLDALKSNGALELAARAILTSRRRWIFGDLKSTGYAVLFSVDLAAALREVTLIQPSMAAAVMALTDAHPSDTLTVFSFRHYSQLTLRLAREFHTSGGTVVALTDSYTSPISQYADHVLPINTGSESATHSPTAVVAVGHILASLAGAGAKGAGRRSRRRAEVARALHSYAETTELASEEPTS